jgi:hypothetical protein
MDDCPMCRTTYDFRPVLGENDQVRHIYNGSNEKPTSKLFNGRKWFDTTSKTVETYLKETCGNWYNNSNYYYAPGRRQAERSRASILIHPKVSTKHHLNPTENCTACGIQRTIETNQFLIEEFKNNTVDGIRYCYQGRKIKFKLQHEHWGYVCYGNNAFNYGYCLSCMVIEHDLKFFLDVF